MVVVRNTFVAKPGMASKLAALIKEVAQATPHLARHRVLTDITGAFNTVILEYEVDDIAGFQASLSEYMTNDEIRTKMKGYGDMFLTGHRELLRVM